MDNVYIEHKRGKSTEYRSVHNCVVAPGRTWLTKLVSYTSPVLTEGAYRIRYLGLGIGGYLYSAAADGPMFSTPYPAGYDPYGTNGHTYRSDAPTTPVITTLERPIRRSGTSNPYGTAPATDTWLFGNVDAFYRDTNSTTFKYTVDCTLGDVVYGPLSYMPVSEASLLHSGANPHDPFSTVFAYLNFPVITLHADSILTFFWTLRFAP